MLKRICGTRGWNGPVFFFDSSKLRKTRNAVENLDDDLAVSMRETEKADFIIIAGADPINEAGMAALALRQASRRQAPIVTIDPRPVFLPCDFDHIPAAPGEIERYLGMLVGRAVEKDTAAFDPAAMDFYRGLVAKYKDREVPENIVRISGRLESSKKPVIICGTDVVRETTPAFSSDCARLLRAAGKQAGLFYLLSGAGSFSSALLSGNGDRAFGDIVGDMENGTVRALVLVESNPFHYCPDRQRLDLAISKLELLIVIDYFPSEAVSRASIFYPASTVFETGSTYVNQEGRAQFAKRVHFGGEPIWGGEHPPRVYRDRIPGGDHLPAWKALWEIAGTASGAAPEDIPPEEFIPMEHPAFAGFGKGLYPVDGVRVLRSDSAPGRAWKSGSVDSPEEKTSLEGFELLMVEWIFGTNEFSAWSDSLAAAVNEPFMSINSKDAGRAGISDGDRVILELEGGEIEIKVSVSDRTAEGVLILPRHNALSWRKMKDFSVRLLPDKIRKVQA
jgi:NADH-quinone oxidoreductase subunit G